MHDLFVFIHRINNEEGKESNLSYKLVKQEDGTSYLCRGDMRSEFIERHAQVLEELKADVKRERDLIRLRKEHKKAIEKFRKVQDKLIALGRELSKLKSK